MFVNKAASVLALTLACTGAYAQSTPSGYQFHQMITEGNTFGNHKVYRGIRTVGPVAFSDTGESAFLVEWPGAARGIYTSGARVVAEDGAKFGDTTIIQVQNTAPGNVQMNSAGHVAYLATFKGSGCAAVSCLGLFLENQLQAISAGGSNAFTLAEGVITAPAGSIWVPPAAAKRHKRIFRTVVEHLPVAIPPAIPVDTHIPHTPPLVIQGKPISLGGDAAPVQQTAHNAALGGSGTLAACTVPTDPHYVFPSLWPQEANAAGPIGTVISQGPLWGQRYQPVGAQAPIANWTRKVFFSPDCRVIATAIGPVSGAGVTEIWTPQGLVTRLDSEKGTYHFEGAGDAILPPSSSPIEAGIRINAHCSILVPVTLRQPTGDMPTILIGNPTNPGSCTQ